MRRNDGQARQGARLLRRAWPLARLLGAVLAVLTMTGLLLVAWPPSLTVELRPDAILPETGRAYVTHVDFRPPFPLRVAADSATAATASRLILLEDGRPLGPAHALHGRVRDSGGGAYSHWGSTLYFSTSDGSDPRHNGRRYVASASPTVPTEFFLALAGADLLFLFLTRRKWHVLTGLRFLSSDVLSRPSQARFSVRGRAGVASIVAFGWTAALTTTMLIKLPPFWATNDDIGMAMIVDGFGFAAYPSPALVFSNILYGYALSALPELWNLSRYSLASVALTGLAILSICRSLLLLSPNAAVALTATTLSALLPLAAPQFTMLAGMLTVAGLLHLSVYITTRSLAEIYAAAGLLFFGYLVRSHEFYLVLLVSAPLLSSKIVSEWPVRVLAFAVAALVGSAMLADWHYYQRPEWTAFRELNILRAPFTDFGLVPYVMARPELLDGTNYSTNDIAMLGSWWLVDPFGTNWQGLQTILSRIDLSSFIRFNSDNTRVVAAALLETPFSFVFVPALLSSALATHRFRFGVAWIGLFGAILLFSLLGREPVTRVYYAPAVLMLCFAAIHIARLGAEWAMVTLVVVGSFGAVHTLSKRNDVYTLRHELARNDISSLNTSTVYVTWAATLHLETMYPVFVPMTQARTLRLYGLGVMSLAPFALAHWADTPGGLPGRLARGAPVPFFADAEEIGRLAVYCQERHATTLRTVSFEQLSIGPLFTVACRSEHP